MPDRVSCEFECCVEHFDAEPDFLILDGDGNAVPLELSCIQNFYDSHPADGSTESPTDDSRIRLPTLTPLEGAKRAFGEKLNIDASGPAEYYQAQVHITVGSEGELDLLYRAVIRPEQAYLFLAGYTAKKGTAGRCFLVETHGVNPDEPLDDQIEGVIREEVGKVVHMRRQRDHWGIGPPLLSDHVIEISDGAYSYKRDFKTGKETIVRDPTRVPRMQRRDKEHARAWRDHIFGDLELPGGGKPEFTAEQIRAGYQGLLKACERLLSNLPRASWPAFSRRESAVSYVHHHVDGSGPEIRDMAGELLRGKKRPSPHQLAVRVLARFTSLSLDRIRRLIRV